MLMEGFVQGFAQRKELIIALFVKRFKAATLKRFHRKILTVLCTIPLKITFSYLFCLSSAQQKICQFSLKLYLRSSFPLEVALREEPVIAHFLERFKVAILRGSY